MLAMLLLPAAPISADAPDDGWITTKVRMRLLAAAGTDALDVRVDSVEGRVTLRGAVGSERSRAHAAALAREIGGVTEVRNELVVERDAPTARNGSPPSGFEAP